MADAETPLRIAVVGVSPAPLCGVRDHATILTQALAAEGVHADTHWLVRDESSLGGARTELGAWIGALGGELARERPDAVLLHYSVFALSYRGLPLFVHPLVAALRTCRLPLVSVLHEYAYPWGRDGLAGAAWAVSQRLALLELVRASSALALTTASRVQWVHSRVWLPRREAVLTPVFSNLPAPATDVHDRERQPRVGVFGYSYGPAVVALVLNVLQVLEREDRGAKLRLIGAPGADAPAGRAWSRAARERGLTQLLSFTGKLPAQQLSDELAACTVLLNVDPSGPSSRKTTLAAALASGRPVLALDGHNTWRELLAAGSAEVVAQRPEALAGALLRLLGEPERARALGARGRAFAQERLTPQGSARTLAALLRALALARP